MKIKNIVLSILVLLSIKLNAQICGVSQNLTSTQNIQINAILTPLDTALKYENLYQIDSLSSELKTAFSLEGGIPDAVETYYNLVPNINWINISSAIDLSRILIANDSMVYVDLWKVAKGMSPPSYQPNSIFLRASAEIASGLLKIADKETDLTRKTLYQSWAIKALDSLATMQLPNGAFPFPDLRMYGDPVFSSVIQNFLNNVGADSVNVLQNGWIIDDKGTGEFKFDAGVIANAYYEAYNYTGNVNYKNIAIATGNYLDSLNFNLNYNYNTFASLGLTRAYQLTNDTSYLERAIKTLRYSLFPGQISNGRWVDGHNANSRYHSIIIQYIVPTINLLPSSHIYKEDLDSMTQKAVRNMVEYTYNCGSATGFRWLLKAHQLNSSLISNTLKDSITDLIGQHINQSVINGKYLDIPSIGEYIELLDLITGINDITYPIGLKVNVFPNPTNNILNLAFNLSENDDIHLTIHNTKGQLINTIDQGKKTVGSYSYQIDLTNRENGVYFLTLMINGKKYTQKIIKQ
jgi:Secretion system C-terminal sorting domain